MNVKCVEKEEGYWVACLMINKRNYALGYGSTEELAKENLHEKFKVMLWNRIEEEELLRTYGEDQE